MRTRTKRTLKSNTGALLLILFGSFQIAYWTSANDCDRRIGAPSDTHTTA